MDQASIYTSDAILDQLEELKRRNIEVFQLPSYSPHLNLIGFHGVSSNMNGLSLALTGVGKVWSITLKEYLENLEISM